MRHLFFEKKCKKICIYKKKVVLLHRENKQNSMFTYFNNYVINFVLHTADYVFFTKQIFKCLTKKIKIMTIARFSVMGSSVKLSKFENKTNLPIYAVCYAKGYISKDNYKYTHHSISYTREQAVAIFNKIVDYLSLK